MIALGGWEPFRAADPDVEAGNRAYAEGRFDDALAAYDRAARRGGVDPDGLAFDRGTAELKKSEAIADPAEKRRLAERALEDLKQAARGKDPHVRGAANYNRGNAMMGQDRLEDAIEAYKQALREDPDLDDARLNLELALRRRQKQQQKQPQQQPGQGQGQQGQGQQGQGQQGQQGQGSDSGSNQQGSGDQGSGDQGSNQQNGSNGQGSDQNGSNGQGSNQQNGSNGQGSNQQGSNQPGDQSGQNGQNPRGRSLRRSPQSPKTPIDGKLDDLDNYSRRLQKDEARRRATGKSSDPKHDW
jgi:Ca-activated chloride channel family protein